MNLTDEEVVIVGGGPAGITTALTMITANPKLKNKIVVLEKDIYPRDKICAGAISYQGIKILETLNVEFEVPFVSIKGVLLRSSIGESSFIYMDDYIRVVRRIEFDSSLANLAVERGIRIIDGVRVNTVDDHKQFVILTTSRGLLKAKYVIGCDGVGSVVRRAMGIKKKNLINMQALEVDTEPLLEDYDRQLLVFNISDRTFSGYTWDFPTIINGREMVCRGIYHIQWRNNKINLKTKLSDYLTSIGLDINNYQRKYFSVQAYNPDEVIGNERMILVGESSGIDPLTGEGITQAIKYGYLAGYFTADVLAKRNTFTEWGKVVRKSSLGRNLSFSIRLIKYFYGAPRPVVEKFLINYNIPRTKGYEFVIAYLFEIIKFFNTVFSAITISLTDRFTTRMRLIKKI